MPVLKKRLGIYYIAVPAAVFSALAAAAAAVFLRVRVSDSVLFLFFQIFSVAVPGAAAVKLLRLKLSPLEALTASYGLGLLVNIAVYFLLSPFYLGRFIPYVLLLIIFFSLTSLFILRERRIITEPDRGENGVGLIFAACLFTLTFILLSASNLTPDVSGARGYFHDLTNGVSLIASAYNGFPLEFMQMSGTAHYYHPFFFAYGALLKHCLGFSAFDVGTKFALVTIAPFFGAAFVCLARKAFEKTRYIVISAVSVLLFFFPMVYYVCADLLGFSMSAAFACCAALFLMKAEDAPSSPVNRMYAVSSLFVIGCLGAKGANGVTTVFAVCFVLLLSLIRKGGFIRAVSAGLLYAVPFFACYFLLYQQGPESMAARGNLMLGDRAAYFLSMSPALPEWFRVFLSNALFTLNSHRILCICFVIFLVYAIAARKNRNILADYALGGLLCGFALSNVFMQYGSSELYFVYTVIPMAVTAAVFCVSRLFSAPSRRVKIAGAVLAVSLLPVLAIEAADNFSRTALYFKDAVSYSPLSSNLIFSEDETAAIDPALRPNILTEKEYEGLIWLRENTDEDAVIAEGRYMLHNKYFYGTAFAERRFFLEGWGYVTMEDSNGNTPEKVRRDSVLSLFYGAKDESFVPLLRSLGISYVIIYEYQNPGWRFTNEFGSVTVFENGHIAVYDIRGTGENGV